MPNPMELLESKIRRREEVLRAREADTAARKAELQDLKESLHKLQIARSGIQDAIEDALSDSLTTTIAPTNLLEITIKGNISNPFAPFINNIITAKEAVKIALISII